MNMRLIADSGATKTDWCFTDGHRREYFTTAGINAAVMPDVEIAAVLDTLLQKAGIQRSANVEDVEFYGAGLVSDEASSLLKALLGERFPSLRRSVFGSDLQAAAKALFPEGEGIAVIMGTGGNSCLCKDGEIIRSFRPGGFILGDEGGGATLGRFFLADYFKGLVPESLSQKAEMEFDLDYKTVVQQVYKGKAPSRYLASFAKFIVDNKGDSYAASLLEKNIRSLMERCLCRYGCSRVGVVGSLGLACREELMQLGAEYSLEFVKFLRSPIDGL